MAEIQTAPTKTNLLRITQELKFARLGHELLDQKRNILVNELLHLVEQAADSQMRAETLLKEAYYALEEAIMKNGRYAIFTQSSGVNINAEVQIRKRKVMGISLPVVETSFESHAPYISPLGTDYWMDAAIVNFREVLSQMGKLAELKISIIRLAREVRKVIRKVNALDKIAIPNLSVALHHISSRIEENERDMFVLMKMVKKNLELKNA